MTLVSKVPSPTASITPGETVLVVDDSRAHRRLLSRALTRWGYVVQEAENGASALEICRTEPADLVVSDWMMPGMTGVEFCRAYRDLRGDRPGYFILLTAQTDRAALAEGLENGADDFLSKPVSSVELRARIRAGQRVVNAQRAPAAKNAELSATLDALSEAYGAIDRDLEEARRFQMGLLPDLFVPFDGVDLSMLYRPSGHVGGDMVGWFRVGEGEIGVYAVDVSGHGVSSALMTARVASYFSAAAPERNIALVRDGEDYRMLPPDDVSRRLNALLQKDAESDLYLTMVLAQVSTRTGEVVLCQAGHPSPLIQRADGHLEFREAFSMPVGLVDAAEYVMTRFTLGPGDRLLIHSDGLTECPDPKGALLNESGLASILAGNCSSKGMDLIAAILEGIEAHAAGADIPDDLSAVLIERR